MSAEFIRLYLSNCCAPPNSCHYGGAGELGCRYICHIKRLISGTNLYFTSKSPTTLHIPITPKTLQIPITATLLKYTTNIPNYYRTRPTYHQKLPPTTNKLFPKPSSHLSAYFRILVFAFYSTSDI